MFFEWCPVQQWVRCSTNRLQTQAMAMSGTNTRQGQKHLESQDRTDQDGIRGSVEKSGRQRSNSNGRFRLKSWTPCFLFHLSGMEKHTRKTKHGETEAGTPNTAMYHNFGEVELGSPKKLDSGRGRVLALSGADVKHRGSSAAFTLTTMTRHVSTIQSPPPIHRNLFPKSSSSQHASQVLTNEYDENRRVGKVGMKLTPLPHSSWLAIVRDKKELE